MLAVIRAKYDDDKTNLTIFVQDGTKYEMSLKSQYTGALQEGNVIKIRSVKDMYNPPPPSLDGSLATKRRK